MKTSKVILFLLTLAFTIITSCSADEPTISINQNEDVIKFGLRRTPKEALNLVNSLTSTTPPPTSNNSNYYKAYQDYIIIKK